MCGVCGAAVWANNADAISEQYAGTGALKTDYTRTGKRSFKGVLNDGLNSATRYYLNNFKDGFRQVPHTQRHDAAHATPHTRLIECVVVCVCVCVCVLYRTRTTCSWATT